MSSLRWETCGTPRAPRGQHEVSTMLHEERKDREPSGEGDRERRRRRTRTADTNRDDWRAAEHGRYQNDRSWGESWSITRGQVYAGEPADPGDDRDPDR
jgi:hypothetical protein